MQSTDYQQGRCPFDASAYTGTPDSAPCPASLPVQEVIRQLDHFYAQGKEMEAEGFLESWQQKARESGDWRAELSFANELLGQYRRSANMEKALTTVTHALTLIRSHRMGETLSGATIMLNAATTLDCFGRAADAIPVFRHVCRIYAQKLDPMDYRFAGLYNNMALSFADTEDYEQAGQYFSMALKTLEHCEAPGNDIAVTYCNLAEMYDHLNPEDSRIGQCMEQAWALLDAPSLPRDGYHAFTISKCAPVFDHLGYFLYARELKERAAKIYAGT